MNSPYEIGYAAQEDIPAWMALAVRVRENFPGLGLEGYRKTLWKNIRRKTALCAKQDGKIIGVLLFSPRLCRLSCMAVHPDCRRQGVASALLVKMLSLLPADADVSVDTFREGDEKGTAPRALYKKFGFAEDELLTGFEYPVQRFVLRRGGKNEPTG